MFFSNVPLLFLQSDTSGIAPLSTALLVVDCAVETDFRSVKTSWQEADCTSVEYPVHVGDTEQRRMPSGPRCSPIENPRATQCGLNSIVQALSNVPDFVEFILEHVRLRELVSPSVVVDLSTDDSAPVVRDCGGMDKCLICNIAERRAHSVANHATGKAITIGSVISVFRHNDLLKHIQLVGGCKFSFQEDVHQLLSPILLVVSGHDSSIFEHSTMRTTQCLSCSAEKREPGTDNFFMVNSGVDGQRIEPAELGGRSERTVPFRTLFTSLPDAVSNSYATWAHLPPNSVNSCKECERRLAIVSKIQFPPEVH